MEFAMVSFHVPNKVCVGLQDWQNRLKHLNIGLHLLHTWLAHIAI